MVSPLSMKPPESEDRIRAVDWLRGIAVIFMVQCHSLVLLTPVLRKSEWTRFLLRLDGLVAPTFIFAAGFALALLQVRSAHRGGQRARALRQLRRIGEVLALATLVNVLWFGARWRQPIWLARLDILHCVGLCLLLVLPFTAGLARRPRLLRALALPLALVAFAVSPLAEEAAGAWAYVLNKSTGAVFPLLPWVGYAWLGVYAGAAAGSEGRAGLTRALLFLAALGIVGGWVAEAPLRALYPPHHFFVTNPSNAAVRWTYVCLLLLGMSYVERHLAPAARPGPVRRFVELFGSASLSAYFFHEMLLFKLGFEALWGGRSGWALYWGLTVALVGLTFVLCRTLGAAERALPGWVAAARERARTLWATPRSDVTGSPG